MDSAADPESNHRTKITNTVLSLPSNCANHLWPADITAPALLYLAQGRQTDPTGEGNSENLHPHLLHQFVSIPSNSLARSSELLLLWSVVAFFFFSSEGCVSKGLFLKTPHGRSPPSLDHCGAEARDTHTLEVVFWFSAGQCLSPLPFHVILARAALHPADSSACHSCLQLEK